MAEQDIAGAIRALGAAARWSLRCRADMVAPISAALGLALPQAMCRAATDGSRAALHLGPDEWLLRTAPDDIGWVDAIVGLPCSLVDVSQRQVAFLLSASAAPELLAAGCPLDLTDAAFPPGACTRTVFAKSEILLWRTEAGYVVEAWRSLAPYVIALLAQAERDSAW